MHYCFTRCSNSLWTSPIHDTTTYISFDILRCCCWYDSELQNQLLDTVVVYLWREKCETRWPIYCHTFGPSDNCDPIIGNWNWLADNEYQLSSVVDHVRLSSVSGFYALLRQTHITTVVICQPFVICGDLQVDTGWPLSTTANPCRQLSALVSSLLLYAGNFVSLSGRTSFFLGQESIHYNHTRFTQQWNIPMDQSLQVQKSIYNFDVSSL